MSTFATMAAADARVRSKMDDGTWVEAYSQRRYDGTPSVRFLRFGQEDKVTDVAGGTFDKQNEAGAWDVTIDDATT